MGEKKKSTVKSHVSSACVVSVCVWVSLSTHSQECVMVWSVLQQTLDKVCMLLAAWQEWREGRGETEKGQEGWGQGRKRGRSEAAASLRSFKRFLHIMRRPWIEASRLWGGKHDRELVMEDSEKVNSQKTLFLCIFTLKSQMVIAPSIPVVQNLRQSLLSPS